MILPKIYVHSKYLFEHMLASQFLERSKYLYFSCNDPALFVVNQKASKALFSPIRDICYCELFREPTSIPPFLVLEILLRRTDD